MPRIRTGQRKLWMHSLSGLDASQVPAAIMGIEQSSAMKLSTAVMLLLTPILSSGFRERERERDLSLAIEAGKVESEGVGKGISSTVCFLIMEGRVYLGSTAEKNAHGPMYDCNEGRKCQ